MRYVCKGCGKKETFYYQPTGPVPCDCSGMMVPETPVTQRSEVPSEAPDSTADGDINQGFGNNLRILRVDGDSDGNGLPTSFTVEDKRTGFAARYIAES